MSLHVDSYLCLGSVERVHGVHFCDSMGSRKELCDYPPMLVSFISHLRSPEVQTGFDC